MAKKQSLTQKFAKLSEAKKLLIFLITFSIIGGGYMVYRSFAMYANTPFHVHTSIATPSPGDANIDLNVVASGFSVQDNKDMQSLCTRVTLEKFDTVTEKYIPVSSSTKECLKKDRVISSAQTKFQFSSTSDSNSCSKYRSVAEGWLEGYTRSKKTKVSEPIKLCSGVGNVSYSNQELKFSVIYPRTWALFENDNLPGNAKIVITSNFSSISFFPGVDNGVYNSLIQQGFKQTAVVLDGDNILHFEKITTPDYGATYYREVRLYNERIGLTIVVTDRSDSNSSSVTFSSDAIINSLKFVK